MAISASSLTAGGATLGNPGGAGSQNTASVNFTGGALLLVAVYDFGSGQSVPTLSGGTNWTQIGHAISGAGDQLTLFAGISGAGAAPLTIAWTSEPTVALWSVDQFFGAQPAPLQSVPGGAVNASGLLIFFQQQGRADSAQYSAFGNKGSLPIGGLNTVLGSPTLSGTYALLTGWASSPGSATVASGAGNGNWVGDMLELPATIPGLMGIGIVEAGFGNPGRRVEMVGY